MRSETSIGTAIEYAQRADTMIYSILFTHRMGGRGGRGINITIGPHNGRKVMQRLAHQTGGGFLEVTDQNPIEKIYAQIEDELRNQYSVGYTPDRAGGDGYRKIKLTTGKKGLVVRTRDGYYPKSASR